MSENHFDVVLDDLTKRAVGRLITAEVFDEEAFDALENHLWTKAEGLRDEFAISKQILSCLRSAASAILARAEYDPAVRKHVHRASHFEALLDRLIAGEVRSDRQPGVPRIV